MKMKSSLILFPQALLILIDQGNSIPIHELNEIAGKEKLFEYIKEIGKEEDWVTNMLDEDLREFTSFIESKIGAYSGEHKRKFGIQNNGLCWVAQLAIEYSIEGKKT